VSAAAWSARATPIACVAGAAVFSLGVISLVHAAVTLALQGAAWNFSAWSCLVLAALLVAVRLRRERGRAVRTLYWNPGSGGFRVDGIAGDLALTRVWYGAGWVTLGLRSHAPKARALQLVIWKSAMPAPLWNELALHLLAGAFRGNSHQNKESP